ncbi:MAG: hypothetical protein GY822_14775 [Deltaproteobacteria bacterium]|nr:hypothetical protein [Deltaproteobacteria bacterium]
MNKAIPISLLTLAFLVTSVGAHAAGWEKIGTEEGVVIYNRTKDGTDTKEVKAKGTINAPSWVVKNVIDDVKNYKDFMPYTEVSKVIKTEKNAIICYQFLDMPMVSNRDYVLRIRDKSFRKKDGTVVYKNAWTPVKGMGPKATDDAVRLSINDGYWLLESSADGKKTKVTYYVYTDPGGSIPSWIANRANTLAIPALFKAVRGQVKKARYRKTKPVLPGEEAGAPAPAKPAP